MTKEILFCEDVSYQTIQKLMEKCANETDVTILLSSKGGNPEAAITFLNFIKFKNIKLTINVLGNCESAAVTLLCAADRRIAAKNCIFLIHPITKSWGQDVCFTEEDLGNLLTSLQALNKKCIDIITEATKKDVSEIKILKNKQTVLTAQQAFELGLLTETPY